MRGTAARHLIDHVDRVAAAYEILRPAFAPVRRPGEVGTGLAAAVHHHDRIRLGPPRRNHVLDVHVAEHRAAFGGGVDLAADEEIARACERERPPLLRLRDARGAQQRRRCRGRDRSLSNSAHAFLLCLFLSRRGPAACIADVIAAIKSRGGAMGASPLPSLSWRDNARPDVESRYQMVSPGSPLFEIASAIQALALARSAIRSALAGAPSLSPPALVYSCAILLRDLQWSEFSYFTPRSRTSVTHRLAASPS